MNLVNRPLEMPPVSTALPLKQSGPGLSPQPEAKCLNEGLTYSQMSQWGPVESWSVIGMARVLAFSYHQLNLIYVSTPLSIVP